jgi:protein TonB
LDLKAEQHGTGWQLTWNSHAPSVVNASGSRLFITDGYLQKKVDMTAADLRTGKIFYAPAMDNVVLRLEIINQRGESVAESVRILAGFLPPLSSGILDAATSTHAMPNSRTSFRTSRARGHQPESPKVAAPSEASAMGSTASSEPAIAMRHDEVGNSTTDNKPLALVGTGSPTIPSAITRLPEAKAQSSAMQQPFSKNSPAQLILQIDPAYPPAALDRRLQGKVIVKAVVEKDGRVSNVRVVSGPPILAQAAVDAMWKWQYNPASVNGQYVQSESEVKFNFRLP